MYQTQRTVDEQELCIMDYDRMRVYPMEEIIMWHAEYNDIKDKPNQVDLNQYIELITSKNGSCDKIYLNNDCEMDYINSMLNDGIELDECIETIDNENCFEPIEE